MKKFCERTLVKKSKQSTGDADINPHPKPDGLLRAYDMNLNLTAFTEKSGFTYSGFTIFLIFSFQFITHIEYDQWSESCKSGYHQAT